MGFRINTNIAAMNAHSSATLNNRNLDSSLSKLSSGLRINTAADDASGMVIANSLRNQASSLGQAISNGNDAIGLIQTADGALSEYSKILDTIKTKSVQAASDGQNPASRLAIQKDIGRLMEELNTISKTTSFNGQKLLSGAFTNKEFQMGATANESVKASIGSTETNKVGQTTRATLDVVNSSGGSVSLNITSPLTGQSIQLKEVNLSYNNNPTNGMGALADEINRYSGETGIRAKAVVESTTGVIKGGSTDSAFAINGITIGSVIVQNGDNSGSLLSAINSKATQTGVSATLNQDGSMKLVSSDGRAIKVEGDTAGVLGKASGDMSTLGKLELVQKGSAEFQITNKSVSAVGLDLTVNATVVTVADSTIAAGSQLALGSIFAAGSTMGGDATVGLKKLDNDTLLKAGSTLMSGSILKQGTVLGGDFTTAAALTTVNEDMLVTAGSTLISGSILKAGTVMTTEYTNSAGDIFHVGETLSADLTLNNGDLIVAADMTVKRDSTVAANSILKAGSSLGKDMTTTGNTVTYNDMTMKGGSTVAASSILKEGSVVGGTVTTTAITDVRSEMLLKIGSSILANSVLAAGSTVGVNMVNKNATVLTTDMSIKSGSILTAGSILKAGTVVNQDLASTVFDSGTTYKAGDIVKNDETVKAAQTITLTADMNILKGSTLGALSTVAQNDGKMGTISLGATSNSSLAEIDVTTLDGAMKAMDTLDAAITDLDTIRSDLGSVQNQIVSTINNISVTQVNVKAAESQLRDVDFAAESANFSKFNILAQSGSYAMSQANAVQQNVLRLLQ